MKVPSEVKHNIALLIDEAYQSGARKLAACDLLEISLRTYQRWQKGMLDDKRKGASKKVANKLSEEEIQHVINVSCEPDYRNLPPEKIVPKLADKGIYIASESTFRRVLSVNNLLTYRGESKPKQKCQNLDELIATGPNQVWSWDITYLKSDVKGLYYFLYLIMDVWSRYIVGYEVHKVESGELASQLIKSSCLKQGISRGDLFLHSDNGSPMKCATMLATLQWLGVNPSYSRPSVSNDNAYSESLFRTLKFKPGYPKYFESLEKAQVWVKKFVNWYNSEHLHSKIKFVTPEQRHKGKDKKILSNRSLVYKQAFEKNPQRWPKGKTRNWDWESTVILNAGTKKSTGKKIA